jgi:hypothetical protein
MCSVLSAISTWLDSHQYIALWLEGIALLAIFIWDRIDASQQHEQTLAQLRASHAAANAAKSSADALISSERAWIMAELKLVEPNAVSGITQPDNTIWTHVHFDLICTNAGTTPAWIFEQSVCVEVTDRVIFSNTPYPTPEILKPDGRHVQLFYQIWPVVKGDPPIQSRGTTKCKGWATRDNRLYTYIYGVVRYRDAFSPLRETYFGYVVTEDVTLNRIPSEAYNKHT